MRGTLPLPTSWVPSLPDQLLLADEVEVEVCRSKDTSSTQPSTCLRSRDRATEGGDAAEEPLADPPPASN